MNAHAEGLGATANDGTGPMTDASAYEADAIRYAVLRKLASGMRHALVTELQTIQFSAELAARMQHGGANGPELATNLERMSDQVRAAIDSARSVIEWLRPDDNATTTVDEALQQCLRVAGDDWRLRGIEASTTVRTGGARVSRAALHDLLVTSLLALIDTHPGAIDIEVAAESADEDVVLRLRARSSERRSPFPSLTVYRSLTCEDVVTMGRAHGVECSCTGDSLTLRLPAVPAAA